VERPALEVADIFGRFGASFLEQHPTSAQHRRVVGAITTCRTAVLGGHLERCDTCRHERNAYNSCRDRHCPKCGSLAREQWIAARSAELLPIPYFHVVFTLPEFLRPVAWQNQAAIYNILFHAAASALQKVAADPKHLGARIGLLAVLHTWNQKLLYHPHIHCIVSGGGLSPDDERWVPARDNYFLPVRVLSRVYRGIFIQALRQAYREGKLSWHGKLQHLQEETAFNHYIQAAWEKPWVVYSKAPFAGPQRVVATVGRYTHGIAMSNQRLIHLDPPLLPSLGNQQPHRPQRRHRHVLVARPRYRATSPPHHPGARVHAAFSAARSAKALRATAALRLPGECASHRAVGTVPAPARCTGAGRGARRALEDTTGGAHRPKH
jgi:hypothetical protein